MELPQGGEAFVGRRKSHLPHLTAFYYDELTIKGNFDLFSLTRLYNHLLFFFFVLKYVSKMPYLGLSSVLRFPKKNSDLAEQQAFLGLQK